MKPFTVTPVAGLLVALAVSPAPAQDAPTNLVLTAGPESFVGLGTDARFPTQLVVSGPGKDIVMQALGSGVRKKMIFKVYECVAYAEAGAVLEPDPAAAFIEGDFAKRILMYFERDVDGGKIRGAFEEGFAKVQGDQAWTEALLASRDRFISYFQDAGVKDGQWIELTWVPGWGLYTVIAGMGQPVIDDAELASALWAIWLGDKPVSDDLKRDMLRFLSADEGD